MKYANTIKLDDGREIILVVLPLTSVSAFDPGNPPEQAYQVDDEVQPGWQRTPDGGWAAPLPNDPQ
jgi:hypothetical protein